MSCFEVKQPSASCYWVTRILCPTAFLYRELLLPMSLLPPPTLQTSFVISLGKTQEVVITMDIQGQKRSKTVSDWSFPVCLLCMPHGPSDRKRVRDWPFWWPITGPSKLLIATFWVTQETLIESSWGQAFCRKMPVCHTTQLHSLPKGFFKLWY